MSNQNEIGASARTEEEKKASVQIVRSMPGYPWFPCRICVGEGFKGMGGCDHTAYERAKASGIHFGSETKQ